MNSAEGVVLAMGTATAQRMQAGLPEDLKTQDGCEPQEDSSPEPTSAMTFPHLCWPAVTSFPALAKEARLQANPTEESRRKTAEGGI